MTSKTWTTLRCLGVLATCALTACAAADASSDSTGTQAPEQNADQGETVFNMTAVSDFALTLDPAAMVTMNAEMAVAEANRDIEHLSAPRSKAKGKLTHAGVAYDVEVKIKGMWSAQGFDEKPSLRVDFDKNFFGLKSLTLNAMVQDPTMVHEALAYKLYDLVGVPVPRTGYSRVSVNGKALGVYLTLEAIDKNFLARKFGDATGIVYEGTYGGDLRDSDVGSLKLVHQSDKTNPQEEMDHGKLKELIAAVNRKGDDLFYGPSAIVETDTFLSMMAMAFVIGDWDNYITANNYRIHRSSATGRWSFIPTGTDQTFQKAMSPFRGNGGGSFPILFEKCLASERCTAGYRDAIAKAVTAFKSPDGGLAGTMTRRMALIDASVTQDTRKPYDAAGMQNARAAMKTLIEGRPDGIAAALKCVANGKEIFPGACAGSLLRNGRGQTCMDVSRSEDGAQVHSWECHSAGNQRWLITPSGSDFQLVATHSGECLDVDGAATADGAALVQRACANKPEQLFTMKAVSGGVQLIAKHSGKCLDLASADAHANLTQSPCSSSSSQVWIQHPSLFE
ncbi:MAG: hypothetical protein QOI41_4326 [Myxococcales bacterium]|nr:hypothetical protein [Myxococcales bacterium]